MLGYTKYMWDHGEANKRLNKALNKRLNKANKRLNKALLACWDTPSTCGTTVGGLGFRV